MLFDALFKGVHMQNVVAAGHRPLVRSLYVFYDSFFIGSESVAVVVITLPRKKNCCSPKHHLSVNIPI